MMAIGRFFREGFAQRKSPRERRDDTIRLELDDGSPLTMLKGAQIAGPDGAPVKCIVRDLSHTGAKIDVRGPVPDTFDLVFGDRSRRSCTVVWRKETQLGVKFRQPIASRYWTFVQALTYCGIVWVALDLTQYFAGRAAAWGLGILLLLVVIFILYRQLRKQV